MITPPANTGRPLPAAIALGFAGAAMASLLLRDIFFLSCGNPAATGAALAVFPLAVAAGAALCRRYAAGRDPADLLAPLLGLFAVSLPASLVLVRAVRPVLALTTGTALSPLGVLAAGLVAFPPVGLSLGLGLALVAAVASRPQPAAASRPPLPLAVAAAGTLGALFIQLVVLPKLTPVNGCLDMGIGCAVAGLICAAGAPGGRRFETWLSLLAFGFVLLLPVSGLIDARLEAFAWQCPVANLPASPENVRPVAPPDGHGRPAPWALAMALAATGLAAGAVATLGGKDRPAGLSRDAARAAAAGMAEAAVLVGLFLAYELSSGRLYDHLALLAAAFLAGEGLALHGRFRRQEPLAVPAPCPPALIGAAVGCLLPSLLFSLFS